VSAGVARTGTVNRFAVLWVTAPASRLIGHSRRPQRSRSAQLPA